jgi:hypothetical protein
LAVAFFYVFLLFFFAGAKAFLPKWNIKENRLYDVEKKESKKMKKKQNMKTMGNFLERKQGNKIILSFSFFA